MRVLMNCWGQSLGALQCHDACWAAAPDLDTAWLRRFGAGVPCKQYRLIHKDGLRISSYVARTFDGVARNSHLRKDNYFYYNCLTGRFTHESCPSYLIKENFTALKSGLIDNLTIATGTFMEALTSRTYTKVPYLAQAFMATHYCWTTT